MCLIPLVANAEIAEGPTTPVPVLTVGVAKVVQPPSDTTLLNHEECSCIKGARGYGVPIPLGTDAKDIKGNSSPVIGGLVLFRYPKDDHVAVIEGFNGGFEVVEWNYRKGPCVATRRTVAWNDPAIRGFASF